MNTPLHSPRIHCFASLALLLALFVGTHPAHAQQFGSGADTDSGQIIQLLCVKHSLEPEAVCDAFAAFVTAPPMLLSGQSGGMLDALFDPGYEADQLKALALQWELPAASLAAAVYDYKVWDLARQAAGRAPLRSEERTAGKPLE